MPCELDERGGITDIYELFDQSLYKWTQRREIVDNFKKNLILHSDIGNLEHTIVI